MNPKFNRSPRVSAILAPHVKYGVVPTSLIDLSRSLEIETQELAEALERISEIENRAWGLDWEEISEARVIAKKALARHRANQEVKP